MQIKLYLKVFAKTVKKKKKKECGLLKISPIFAFVVYNTHYSLLVTSAAVCTLRFETIALCAFTIKKKAMFHCPAFKANNRKQKNKY